MNRRQIAVFLLCFVAAAYGCEQYWRRQQPTADELYGCTVEQQAPNGECQ